MKNKMIKTAGLVLASTTMLMANGVVANESIQDKPCEVKVMEDGQAGKFVVNFGIAIFTAGKIENAFDYDYKCLKEENKIEGPGYSYPMKFNGTVIATSNSKPHPLAKVFGDNNNEVTTFTSEDGTLEIKVKEKNTQREMDNISYETIKYDVAKPENIELHLTASDISSNNKLQQIIEEPIIVSVFDPLYMKGTIVFIESNKNTDGSATMNLKIIGPDFFNKKTDGGELTEEEFNLVKEQLGFIPADRFSSTSSFNEITVSGFDTFTSMVMDKLDIKVGFNTSATLSGSDLSYTDFIEKTIKRGDFNQKITDHSGRLTIEPIDNESNNDSFFNKLKEFISSNPT